MSAAQVRYLLSVEKENVASQNNYGTPTKLRNNVPISPKDQMSPKFGGPNNQKPLSPKTKPLQLNKKDNFRRGSTANKIRKSLNHSFQVIQKFQEIRESPNRKIIHPTIRKNIMKENDTEASSFSKETFEALFPNLNRLEGDPNSNFPPPPSRLNTEKEVLIKRSVCPPPSAMNTNNTARNAEAEIPPAKRQKLDSYVAPVGSRKVFDFIALGSEKSVAMVKQFSEDMDEDSWFTLSSVSRTLVQVQNIKKRKKIEKILTPILVDFTGLQGKEKKKALKKAMLSLEFLGQQPMHY
eukprot:TRINITY_DN5616_c0_g1_i2.p1 TRINITY_DN5616_c0_g1~~TRINITY_DN5616_c0_g1_i2.p1  ORF type:complete len:295 (+),score=69.12 TRINITY_DN5616_c0_g1_i2:69-953(+)